MINYKNELFLNKKGKNCWKKYRISIIIGGGQEKDANYRQKNKKSRVVIVEKERNKYRNVSIKYKRAKIEYQKEEYRQNKELINFFKFR